MAHVITGTCLGCKCGNCAQMCPVDAFREGGLMLFIDPDVCIDCEACRGQCERGAIFSQDDLPEIWDQYEVLNAEESAHAPSITGPQEPMGFPIWKCTSNRPTVDRESVA